MIGKYMIPTSEETATTVPAEKKCFDDVFPTTLICKTYKYLFGLVKINVTIEDRKAQDPSRNYKHLIEVKIFHLFTMYVILRSSSTGYYKVNDIDLIDELEIPRK